MAPSGASPEGTDHLVADQQDVVLVADLPDPLEVTGRRREAAAGVLHRLEEHRRDRLGSLVLDRDRDLVGGPSAERLEVAGGVAGGGERLGRAVEVRVRHPERRGHQRLEHRLEARQACDRQRALGGAVVGDRAADHLVLHRLAGDLEVVLGQLPRRLDGLAATAGEEHPVEVAGRVVGDPLGQLNRIGVRVGPQREVRQLAGLLGGGLGELLAPVPELADEQAAEGVEVALALGVVHVGAFAAHDHRDVRGVVARHPGEVHPQVLARGLLQPGVGLVVERGTGAGGPLGRDGGCGGAELVRRHDLLLVDAPMVPVPALPGK